MSALRGWLRIKGQGLTGTNCRFYLCEYLLGRKGCSFSNNDLAVGRVISAGNDLKSPFPTNLIDLLGIKYIYIYNVLELLIRATDLVA